MSEGWLHFVVVIVVQALLFAIFAYCFDKKFSDLPRVLGWGALIGIVVGIPLDLVAGEFFGLYSYTLGFGLPFLIVNAALSYGFFAASILVMQRTKFLQFFIWSICIMAVYEIADYFFRVWRWGFVLPRFEFLVVLIIAYFIGALTSAAISHTLLGRRFFFIDELLKRY